MQKSRKKFWIVFSCVFAGIIAVCGMFALITRLKTVTVEFRTRLSQEETMLEEGVLNRVLETGDFDYGKTVLFIDFEESIQKIEKSNPFVKVEQVVRHFPNTARVYISERVPMYRVQDIQNKNKWYILDEDFKVLADCDDTNLKSSEHGNYYGRTIEISPDSLTLSSYIGEFVVDETARSFMNTIASGVKGKAGSISVVKSVSFKKQSDKYTFTLTMKNSGINNDNGCEIVIVGSDNLRTKVVAGVACFCENTENQETFDLSSKVIKIEEVNGQLTGIMSDK